MSGFLWLEWRRVRPWLYVLAGAAIMLPLLGYLWPLIFKPGHDFPPSRPDPELGLSIGYALGIATLAFSFLLRNWRRGKLPEVLFLSPYHDLAGLLAQFSLVAAVWTFYTVALTTWSQMLARLWLQLPYNPILSFQSGLYSAGLVFVPAVAWLVLLERFAWRFRLYRLAALALVFFLSGSAFAAWLVGERVGAISGELLSPWRILQGRWPTGVRVMEVSQEPLWAALLLALVFLGWAWAIGREVEL